LRRAELAALAFTPVVAGLAVVGAMLWSATRRKGRL